MNHKGIEFKNIINDVIELKTCSRSEQSYKKHIHYELSLGIIRKGSTTVEFPHKTIQFHEGDGVLIPPRLSHMCSPEDVDMWRFDMLYINPAFYQEELTFTQAIKIQDTGIIEGFISLIKEEVSQSILEDHLIGLLIQVAESNRSLEILTVREDKDIISKIKKYIEAHYLEEISLEILVNQFGLNKFAMIRLFNKNYNATPMAYQLQLKVAQAKKQLMAGEDIHDVCFALGFYDQAHFIREFKKMNGLSPKAYQKSIAISYNKD